MKTVTLFFVALFVITTSFTNVPRSAEQSKISSVIAKAISSDDFSFFRTHRQGKGMTATWGMISEANVTGYIVQRTYEDITDPYAYWEDLAVVDAAGDNSYKFTETQVFPGYISYRIVAMNGLTEVAVSEIITKRILQH